MTRRPSRKPGRRNLHAHDRSRSSRLPESVETLTIERIAAGGDGVARANGMAVFVPRTAPGDVAQVAYVSHARHGRGRVLQLLNASSARVEPQCRHYEHDRCGGCQLQHLDVATQRAARQAIVQETLRRIGKREVPLPPLDSGEAWGYRSRLTLTLKRKGQSWIGGLHPHDDPTRIFALETCHIAHPLLVAVWENVRVLLRRSELSLPRAGGAVPASLRLSLRLESEADGGTGDGVQLVLEGGTEWPGESAWVEAAQRADHRVRGVWWTADRSAPGADLSRVSATAPTIDYAPQAREALAFAQVNADVAARLRDAVYEAVLQFGPALVIDGYAGVGRLSERLVHAGVPVIAVEADSAGAERAAARLHEAGTAAAARSRVVCDLMERALTSFDQPADVVVLNPPRRGVHADVTTWLEAPAQRALRGVVYVSCDPATLARDLARLPSWRVERVQCFDMFPQTAHVETVCVLHRENT